MAERCAPHGLAVGADGSCVLCRREGVGASGSEPAHDATRATRSLTALLVALGVVLLAVAGYAVWPSGASNETNAPPRAAPEARTPTAATPEERVTRQRRELPPPDEPVPRRRTIEIEGSHPRAPTGAREGAKAPTKDDLEAALRAVRITMYSTTWCPHCTRARAWLTGNNIAFTERDVEASESARRDRDRVNPKGGVPTVDIDGEVLTGFGERSWSAAIARATQRRLDQRAR